MIRETYAIEPGEIDMPTFPLFALFDPALGMAAVIPDMDAGRPADVKPENIIEPILRHGVTNMFGSPALIDKVGRYGEAHGVKLPSLERAITAGAPVSARVLEPLLQNALPRSSGLHPLWRYRIAAGLLHWQRGSPFGDPGENGPWRGDLRGPTGEGHDRGSESGSLRMTRK